MLYLIRPDAVAESIIGLNIYRVATKGFELSYNVICVDGLTNCDDIRHITGGNIRQFVTIATVFKPTNIVELIKFLESLAIKIAKKIDAKFVVTPLFRDELTILSLAGILMVSRTIFSEGLPIKVLGDIKVSRPFFYVISADISILGFLERLEIESKLELECDEFIRKAKRLFYTSTELMYSSIKTVELLQTYAFGSTAKCKYCGAYSLDNVCEICKKIHQYVDVLE